MPINLFLEGVDAESCADASSEVKSRSARSNCPPSPFAVAATFLGSRHPTSAAVPLLLLTTRTPTLAQVCNFSRGNRMLRILRLFKLAKLTRCAACSPTGG